MSQDYDSTFARNIKAGKIKIVEERGKVKLFAFNHQRRKQIHIGSVIGATYEKMAAILIKPEPSFLLNQAELGAIEEVGAGFIRIIPIDRSGTYSISVQDFKRHAQPYYNASYGPQLRCAKTWFESTPQVQKRNNFTDNPPLEQIRDIVSEKQMSLFGGMK